MDKYIAQLNNYQCGAYAIFNALVWLGRQPTQDMILKIWKAGGRKEKQVLGMSFRGVSKALNKLKIKYEYMYMPGIDEVDASLYAGEAMILAYYSSVPDCGHYVFCAADGNRYLVTNESVPSKKRNRSTMKKMLRARSTSNANFYARCWFIKKDK